MPQTASYQRQGADKIMIISYLSLVVIGWLMLFSTVYDEKKPYAFLDINTPIGAQSVWLLISLLAFVMVLQLDWKFWNGIAFPFYAVTIVLLIAVLLGGKVINGSKSWFSFGPLSFQPSEWAKFGTALALSGFLSFNKSNLTDFKTLTTSLSIIFLPVLLILLQPDAGSAMVFMSMFILLYRRGLSGWIFMVVFILIGVFVISLVFSPITVVMLIMGAGALIYGLEHLEMKNNILLMAGLSAVTIFLLWQKEYLLSVIPFSSAFVIYTANNFYKKKFRLPATLVPAAIFFISIGYLSEFAIDKVLRPHQQDRINVWLRPEKCDPRGSLYNIIQSKLAIGSGGFTGKGYLSGEMTKLNYVPEQSTDFIFTSIAEEQGFLGSLGVILIFTILVMRCIYIAEKTRLEFIRNFAYCVGGIIFFHFAINLGMTMGLVPVVGIPLPFISKGGSSLLTFSVMVATVIKMGQAK